MDMIDFIIAEDEYLQRALLTKLYPWEEEGFRLVGEVSDGETGLELFFQLKPKLVITDINMPYMDGLSMSEEIKKAAPDTEIIIVTGYDEFEYARRAVNIGVSCFLLKSIKEEDLRIVADKVKKKILARRSMENNIRQNFIGNAIDGAVENDMVAMFRKVLEELDNSDDERMARNMNYSELVLKTIDCIEDCYCDPELSLRTLALKLFVNESYLSRVFKKETQIGISDYIQKKRIDKACYLIRSTDLINYQVAERVGINNPHYFGQCFKKQTKLTVTEYRNFIKKQVK